jgi:hypothetical protein
VCNGEILQAVKDILKIYGAEKKTLIIAFHDTECDAVDKFLSLVGWPHYKVSPYDERYGSVNDLQGYYTRSGGVNIAIINKHKCSGVPYPTASFPYLSSAEADEVFRYNLKRIHLCASCSNANKNPGQRDIVVLQLFCTVDWRPWTWFLGTDCHNANMHKLVEYIDSNPVTWKNANKNCQFALSFKRLMNYI